MADLRHSCWRWTAGFCIAAALVFGIAISQAGRFLEAPASSPSQADVLVALGGESGDRVVTAASLFRDGVAPRMLVTGFATSPHEVRPALRHWRAQVLAEQGVPLESIIYDVDSTNSWEEAVNTRRVMEANGWRRVVVVSDPYHMRRLSWAWGRVFRESGLSYSLVASSPQWWDADRWWHDENSALVVINEFIKLAYYLIKY